VFLSHSSRDRAFAERLADALAEHGVPVFFSRRSIRGAQQWHDEIGAALRRCDWFGIVLSPAAVESKWVKRELLYALKDDRYEERIIPILLRRCRDDRLSWVLPGLQHVSFTRSFDDGCQGLLRIWGIGYRRRGR
jgi:hypothetical protein